MHAGKPAIQARFWKAKKKKIIKIKNKKKRKLHYTVFETAIPMLWIRKRKKKKERFRNNCKRFKERFLNRNSESRWEPKFIQDLYTMSKAAVFLKAMKEK